MRKTAATFSENEELLNRLDSGDPLHRLAATVIRRLEAANEEFVDEFLAWATRVEGSVNLEACTDENALRSWVPGQTSPFRFF